MAPQVVAELKFLYIVGMLAFALPMSISAGRIYLRPVTLLFVPLMVAGAMMAIAFGPLAQAIGIGLDNEDALRGQPNEDGVLHDGTSIDIGRHDTDGLEPRLESLGIG